MMDDFHKQKTLPDLHTGQTRFPIPKQIGPYKIKSLLNKGGMSVLFLGTHPEIGEPIVIKVLVPKYLKNKEMVNRFLNEAQIIEMASHPNIVRLYGHGEWEKGLYIAMEFIRGISLRQFIQKKSLSNKRALEIVLQVAYALSHLHTHGVIHRDLKPENILITESGDIKVIDFGIAQLQGNGGAERITQRKRMMGTPVYMSPEQKENPSQVSFSSDIYSLGIIMYELILGRLSHGVIHLSLLPKSLRTIIDKALKADPKERYLDIVDFITDVTQYIAVTPDQEEVREDEVGDEVMNLIEKTRSLLIPKKGPKWPQIEIGLALQEGMSLSGLYIDYFHFPDNRYCVVVAEPLEMGIETLLHAAIFRGMFRMAIQHDHHPLKMLHALNQAIHLDPMKQQFCLSMLVLSPEQDQLSFISCDHSPLWHWPEGSTQVRSLTTPNPALGREDATLLETADNWNAGDTLILQTLQMKEPPDKLEEAALLPPQPQAEKILQKLSRQKANRAGAVLSIQRIF